MNKRFLFSIKILIVFIVSVIFYSSCVTSKTASNNDKVYADIIGFNDDVTKDYKYYYIGKGGTDQRKIEQAIKSLKSGTHTAAYYALDVGLDRIIELQKKNKDPNTRYYIVMLTDGLDNISQVLAERNGYGDYSSLERYSIKLQQKMKTVLNTTTIFGTKPNNSNSFQSYVLMFKGNDIKESNYTDEKLLKNLSPLTGAQNEYPPTPLMAEDFDTLYTEFTKNFLVTSFSFLIPKGYLDSKIQMRFTDAQGNPCSVEGTFSRETVNSGLKKTYKYKLKNIETSSDFEIQMTGNYLSEDTSIGGINDVGFTINNLRYNGMPYTVKKGTAQQWFYDDDWRINSEYNANAGKKKNAYILFLLDTSKSLGAEAAKERETAIKIINYISDEM